MKILLLGPGFETWRLPVGSPAFGIDPAETAFGIAPAEQLCVVDYNRESLDFWRARGARCVCTDLRQMFGNFLLRTLINGGDEAFDEVHAYEVLNLLTGDSADFFRFWRFIWEALKPGGRVWATVPHWESQWIHAHPAPQRTYTPGLLGYLNQDSNNLARERFSAWPKPYRFKIENSWVLSGGDNKPQGWHFCLVKVEAGT